MRLKLAAILGLLLVGGVAVFVTLGGLPRSAAAATTYLTSTAAVADVSNDIAATGAIASSDSWALVFGSAPGGTAATDAAGSWQVSGVKVKVGDRVTSGAVLASATNATLAGDIAVATNDVRTATIQLSVAQDASDAATTTATVRQTRIGLLGARNSLAQAKAKLDDLRAQLGHGSLVAPADGIVTVVNVTVGANAPTADAIDLVSTSFEVTANVVESDIATLQVGQPGTVTVAAVSADLSGTVTAIAPVAETSTSAGVVSYAVTVTLQSPPPELRPGMTASVTITTASASSVLAVPAAAVRGTNGSYTVLVLTAANTPEARPVTVGLMTSALVEITSGLTAGDVVVTGTSSTQRAGTVTGGGQGGTFVVPGGGGFGGRGAGN